jgi:hypothetical protein
MRAQRKIRCGGSDNAYLQQLRGIMGPGLQRSEKPVGFFAKGGVN